MKRDFNEERKLSEWREEDDGLSDAINEFRLEIENNGLSFTTADAICHSDPSVKWTVVTPTRSVSCQTENSSTSLTSTRTSSTQTTDGAVGAREREGATLLPFDLSQRSREYSPEARAPARITVRALVHNEGDCSRGVKETDIGREGRKKINKTATKKEENAFSAEKFQAWIQSNF